MLPKVPTLFIDRERERGRERERERDCLSHVVLSWLLSVCYFSKDELRRQKIAQSFLFTAKIMTKYYSEGFLSICGEKMSEGF